MRLRWLAVLILGVCPVTAWAIPGPAYVETSCFTSGDDVNRACHLSSGGIARDAEASLTTLSSSASLSITSALAFPVDVFAHTVYEVEITGTFQPGDPAQFLGVPLIFTRAGSTSAGSGTGFLASASVFIGSFGGMGACQPIGFNCVAGNVASFGGSETVYTSPGVYQVRIFASVSAETGAIGTASAFADPTIAIDPAFLATHPGFGLTFSGNLPAPEPAEASLLLTGLAGLLVRAKRRR
jgi:hypothetical protein